FSVSRYMPLTNASITVSRATTSVNASAVINVTRQRTIRLRMLYPSGTLAKNSKAATTMTTTARASHSFMRARLQNADHESTKVRKTRQKAKTKNRALAQLVCSLFRAFVLSCFRDLYLILEADPLYPMVLAVHDVDFAFAVHRQGPGMVQQARRPTGG